MISRALAGHGVVDTGSDGGGNAVLIILGVAILFLVFYMGRKKWRKLRAEQDDNEDSSES
ncbi:MAG: hypothetical protein VX741_10700 [Pseudomonadota bacterium]|nr:hypothetical protein [Pseudomonadota bacterium]